MPHDISAWINGDRDYEAGLALLRAYNASTFILDILATGPGAFNNAKLLKELQRIPEIPIIPADGAIVSDGIPEIPVIPSSRPAAAAPIYKPDHNIEKQLRIKKQIKDLKIEITYLHGRLGVLPEGDELHRAAKDVVTKDLRKQDLWQHLHYFERHGEWYDELPENQVPEFDASDPQQLEAKINNLMASRSKVTKLLKSPWPPAQLKHHRERQAAFTQQIEYYRSLRKNG